MLAMADQHGRVWASVPGLANRARVPLADAQTALDAFLSPDPYSRTPDFEGRRIEPIDGGWRLLNHEKYRAIRDEESIKESKRKYINARRAAEREGVEQSRTQSNAVDAGRANAEADTEAECIDAPSKKSPRGTALSKDWVLPVEWAEWARNARPDIDPAAAAESFRDYWVARPGKDGRKSDWQATWRNWIRNQRVQPGARPQTGDIWAGAVN